MREGGGGYETFEGQNSQRKDKKECHRMFTGAPLPGCHYLRG